MLRPQRLYERIGFRAVYGYHYRTHWDTIVNETLKLGDFVQTFQIEDLNIRGRLVQMEDAFARATEKS